MRSLTTTRLVFVLGALVLFAGLAAVLGLLVGPSGLSPGEILGALAPGAEGPAADIVRGIRLPRVVLALLVGACLAVSGVVFQALLRNPLADPFILGISGGAALSGIAVLSLGSLVGLGMSAVPPAAFAGGVATTALLYLFGGFGARFSPTHLLLTGVVFNAIASAAIVFLASASGLIESARIFVWLIGSLASTRIELVGWVAVFLATGLGVAAVLARSLDVLALGDETALQLGVDVEQHKRWLLGATALMVAAAVSVSGLIGFVGLIVPHLLRLLIGSEHRLLVPA
ncbi:MAG: iron ABC transporter permease, partial [Actinomycetota bacterium]|nr:iron ABC transporter permease [Actinomycetota bacterium]